MHQQPQQSVLAQAVRPAAFRCQLLTMPSARAILNAIGPGLQLDLELVLMLVHDL